ncbi:MAG TPA: DNA-directed RNA polymerase subunit alpha [Candidatus Megaira endosymbiont of Hartmannula sinica]|nr:DNA-directed RNA polymerase subunit alpha [Candidatus Megaera endosymbiont of Hartmannula sinica]
MLDVSTEVSNSLSDKSKKNDDQVYSSLLSKNIADITKPSSIIHADNKSNNSCNIEISPLQKGFGTTIGNSLRRILLSSVIGASVIYVKIPGVAHEFLSKRGVKEDILDIILNLKGLKIKMPSKDRAVIRMKVTGPEIVTGRHFELPSGVEILNPDHVICNVSEGCNFSIEVGCALGKGYMHAIDVKKQFELAFDAVPIDALFNPIEKVSINVSDARLGKSTDYDKLVMNIATNGSILPEDAVAFAARIMQDQLQPLVKFEEVKMNSESSISDSLPFNPVLVKKVSDLELSVRSQNCLQNANIVYIGDLVVKTEQEMLKTQNFGRKSLLEIKEILGNLDLKFGMEISDWPPEGVEKLSQKYEEKY